MPDGEDNTNQDENPFEDLEASITDSFSRLQQSIDAHAQKLGEMQESAGDTLFSSDFLNSLNEELTRVADNQEIIIQQQEDLKTEYEELNSKLTKVNSSLTDLSQGISGISLGSSDLDFSPIQSSIRSLQSVIQGGFQSLKTQIGDLSGYEDLNTNLTEINTSLTDLKESISEVSFGEIDIDLSSIQSSIKGVQTVVQDEIQSLAAQIADSSDYEEIKTNLTEVKTSISNLIENISEISLEGPEIDPSPIQSSIKSLQSVVQGGFQSLIRNVENLSASTDFEANFEKLNTNLTEVQNLLSNIDQSISEVSLNSIDLSPIQSSIKSFHSLVQSGLESLITQISNLSTPTDLEERFENLNTNLTKINTSLNNLEQTVSETSSMGADFDLSPIQSSIRSFNSLVKDGFEKLITQIRNSVSQISNLSIPETSESVNYEDLQEAVFEGVSQAMTEIEKQKMLQQSMMGGDRSGQPSQMTAPLQTGLSFGTEDISIPDITGGTPRFANLLTGNTTLSREFPKFLSELESRNESLSEAISLSASELERMEVNLSDLMKTGRQVEEISLADALAGDLSKTAEDYDRVMESLFAKFKSIVGEEGEELVSTTRNIVRETQERLRFMDIETDELFGQITTKIGFEEYYEALNEMAQSLEDQIIDASTVISSLEGVSEETGERMTQNLAGSARQILKAYEALERQGAERAQIQEGLLAVIEQIQEENEDLREEKSEFAELQDKLLEGLQEELDQVTKVKEQREAQNKLAERFLNRLEYLKNWYDDFSQLVSGIWQNLFSADLWKALGAGALIFGLRQTYKQIFEIDKALRQVADNTGLLRENLDSVRDVIFDLQAPLMARGATLQEVAESASLVYKQLQGAVVSTERFGMNLTNVSALMGEVATGFNVSMEAAAGMLNTMQAITSTTGQALRDTLIMTQQLATQRDVAPKEIFNDISEASEEIAKFGEINARNIANAAVNAHELGTNLNEVLGIAEGFRNDIVGSLQSLQEAELMMGQQIPAEDLISSSFQDPEKFTQELRSTLEQLDLNIDGPLATYRLQSLSDAFGVSVMRLRQMAESAQAANKALENVPAGERLGVLNDKIKASQTGFEAVTNTVTGFGRALVNLIAQPISNVISGTLEYFSVLLGNILERFTGLKRGVLDINYAFDIMNEEVSKFGEGAEGAKLKTASFASTLFAFMEDAYRVGKALVKVTQDLATLASAISPVIELISSLVSSFASIGEMIGGDTGGAVGATLGIASLYGGFKLISSGIGMLKSKMLSEAIPAFRSFGSYIGGKLPSKLTSFVGASSSATSASSTAAGAASSAASVFSSFGAQALMVAGAVYTIAESFETFASLSWEEMKKGIVGVSTALIGLSGSVAAVQFAISSFSASALQMAAAGGVLLSLAGSVWILSDAMGAFADAGTEGVKVMGLALTTITAFGAGIATLIGWTGGTGAGLALGAAGVLGAFGLALKIVGSAILDFAESAQMIGDALETINQLENVGQLADKLRDLGSALSSMPDISLGNIFAGMVGEGVADQLEMLADLGRQAQPLDEVASSVNRIADALERLEGIQVSGKLSQIDEVTSTSFTEGAGNFFTSVGTAIEEMFSVDTEPQPTTQTQTGREQTVNTKTGQAQSPTVDPMQNVDESALGVNENQNVNETVQNQEQMITLLQRIAENENALLNALRNGEVAVYMDGDEVTDKVHKTSFNRSKTRTG